MSLGILSYEVNTMNQSLWLDKNIEFNYPRIQEDLTCDLLIIGAGLSALTLAYRFINTQTKVIIVEKDSIMQGSSGRNTGKLTAQHDCVYHQISNKDTAYQMLEENLKAIQWVKDISSQTKIDCCFKPCSTGVFTNNSENLENLEKEAAFYSKHHIPYTYTKPTHSLYPCLGLLKMENQAQFDPVAFGKGLAKQFSENIIIFEDSKITHLQTDNFIQATTSTRFKISASQVVITTLSPLFNLKHFFFSRMEPLRSYIIAAKYNKPFDETVINIDTPSISLRKVIIHDTSYLLFCGSDHNPAQKVKDPYLFLKEFAFQYFEIKNFDYQWSNQDNMTFDHLPFIGPINKNKTIFVACGYNTWGNSQSIVASSILHMSLTDSTYQIPTFCDPHRKSDLLTLKCIQTNVRVGKHYVHGKLRKIETPIELKNGDIVTKGIHQYGYYKDSKGREYLLHLRCPHLGCQLNFNSADDTWDCPCHGSRFGYNGKIITSPAHQDLQQYPGINSIHPHL